MRTALLTAALALAATSARAAEDDDAKKELKKLEGTWVMVSGVKDGAKLPDEHVKKNRMTWKGKDVHLVSPHQSKDPIKCACAVEPAKSPRAMAWVRSEGPHKGREMLAIYEWIDGDSYRVCFAPPGKERPKEFKSAEGSGHLLHVWKRAKE